MVEAPTDNPYVRDVDLDFRAPDSLSGSAAREQVALLREAVEYHDYRYYVENDPVVSDATYDALFDRLETLEDAFDLDDPNSPTRRVGGDTLDELATVSHAAPLLSLDSSEDEADVREFARRVEAAVTDVTYTAEPKFDGFSIEVVYEDGAFDRAVTRGDGETGEDVSRNVRTIPSVPLHLPDDAPDFLSVRGEIYMPRSGFRDLNEARVERGEDPFANPRNAAAGTVRLLDPDTVADRPLDVFFYDVLVTSADLHSQTGAFDLLDELGFPVDDLTETVPDADAIVAYRDDLRERRAELAYEIDGVVAKVDDFDARAELGTTARHPKWAYAYKFPPETEETTVRDITVQVGRTGKLTPVAELDPVEVKGVTITRATLHNEAQAQALGVGEGARVTVERAGDVIPEVVEVLDPAADTFEMPAACPVCGATVVAEGENHHCTNGTSCPAQLQRAIQHFASKGAMDVGGLGEEVAATLVEAGLVGSVADLYDLAVADLTDLSGWGERSARNLCAEIEASKDVDLARFVYALGIRHVGAERARALAEAFTLDGLRTADEDALRAVEDVGPEVAASVVSFFDEERNQRVVDRLLDAGVDPHRADRGDELAGLTLVFTGSIEGYARDDLAERLERHGANVTSSVSGATDYLVVGENPGTRKREAADEHDVPEMDPETFRAEILSRVPEA